MPAIHGTVKALIPKHWEYKAIAVPWYLIGEDFIIDSEADGRNMHREIVRGMKAITIKRYPSSKKLDNDKKIKPISIDIKHNLNLKGEFLFLKIKPTGHWKIESKTSLIVKRLATFCSINGALIIPPFAKSNGRIVCNKLITPVTNRVIDNKGNNGIIHLILYLLSVVSELISI